MQSSIVNKSYKVIAIVVVVALYSGGMFIAGRCSVDPEIKIVEKTKIKWKDKIVYRDYNKMKCIEIQRELLAYDTKEPFLDGEMQGDNFHAVASLHKREWSRDFELKAGAGDSAKWYAVTSFVSFVAGALIGGAVDNKVIRKF